MTSTMVKLLVVSLVIAAVGYFSYTAGFNSCQGKYLTEKNIQANQTIDQVKKENQVDIQIAEEQQKKTEEITKTIVRVKREIIKVPVRDCGLTNAERLSILEAYCANFPDSPSCLPNPVSGSAGASTNGGGDRSKDLGSRPN